MAFSLNYCRICLYEFGAYDEFTYINEYGINILEILNQGKLDFVSNTKICEDCKKHIEGVGEFIIKVKLTEHKVKSNMLTYIQDNMNPADDEMVVEDSSESLLEVLKESAWRGNLLHKRGRKRKKKRRGKLTQINEVENNELNMNSQKASTYLCNDNGMLDNKTIVKIGVNKKGVSEETKNKKLELVNTAAQTRNALNETNILDRSNINDIELEHNTESTNIQQLIDKDVIYIKDDPDLIVDELDSIKNFDLCVEEELEFSSFNKQLVNHIENNGVEEELRVSYNTQVLMNANSNVVSGFNELKEVAVPVEELQGLPSDKIEKQILPVEAQPFIEEEQLQGSAFNNIQLVNNAKSNKVSVLDGEKETTFSVNEPAGICKKRESLHSRFNKQQYEDDAECKVENVIKQNRKKERKTAFTLKLLTVKSKRKQRWKVKKENNARTYQRNISTDLFDLKNHTADEAYVETKNLKTYALSNPNNSVQQKIYCTVCRKVFCNYKNMLIHLRLNHQTENMFNCTKCYCTFKSLAHVKFHQKNYLNKCTIFCKCMLHLSVQERKEVNIDEDIKKEFKKLKRQKTKYSEEETLFAANLPIKKENSDENNEIVQIPKNNNKITPCFVLLEKMQPVKMQYCKSICLSCYYFISESIEEHCCKKNVAAYYCTHCLKNYSNLDDVFKCVVNTKSFDVNNYKAYSTINTMQLRCNSCNITYKNYTELHHHVMEVHFVNMYKCMLCTFFTNIEMSFINHVQQFHKSK